MNILAERLYLPGLGVAAAVLGVLAMLVYYAHDNYAREQALMHDSLTREGQALLVALEGGTRAAVSAPSWHGASLQQLVNELARPPEVLFLTISAGDRQIAGAGRVPGAGVDEQMVPKGNEPVSWLAPDESWFAVARRFEPAVAAAAPPTAVRRWQAWCRMRGWSAAQPLVAVVGLSTRGFLQARAEDTRRFLGTAAALIGLGGMALVALVLSVRNRRTRHELERARTYANNIVESISNGVLSVGRDGRVVSINRVACELFGASPGAVAGRHYSTLVADGDCSLEPTIEKGARIIERELRCRSTAGRQVHVSLSATQLVDAEGHVLGAVAVLRDLQPMRSLEEQLRRSERLASMGRMVAAVAHELRNPLSTLRGMAGYFARKHGATDEDREYAGLMVGETDRLNRTITDLLTFAQPVAPRREDVILQATIAYAQRLCQEHLEERKVTLQTTYGGDLPTIRADGDLLVQVFVNLFMNAAEAMPTGGRVGVEVRAAEEGVHVVVSDEGPGVDEEARERVFDPFFTTKPGGTGLGLAIVHGIVTAHGGRLWVDGEPGPGASFHVLLPGEGPRV